MIDYCRYIKDIEANPRAIALALTIREFMQLRDHVYECAECMRRVDNTLEKATPEDFERFDVRNN